MVLAPPDGPSCTAVVTHDEQGSIAVQPLWARSMQVAQDAHSVGTISASDTRRGPRNLGACDGAMVYADIDHVDEPQSFVMEETSRFTDRGVSACSESLWTSKASTWGRLTDDA